MFWWFLNNSIHPCACRYKIAVITNNGSDINTNNDNDNSSMTNMCFDIDANRDNNNLQVQVLLSHVKTMVKTPVINPQPKPPRGVRSSISEDVDSCVTTSYGGIQNIPKLEPPPGQLVVTTSQNKPMYNDDATCSINLVSYDIIDLNTEHA